MPRLPKPFPWRDGWYTDAGGTRTRLADRSASFTAAQNALRQHLNELDTNGGRIPPTLTVAEMIALFLDTVQAENSPQTYYQYQRWLIEFAKHHVGRQARKVTTLDGLEFKKKLLAAKHPRTGEPLMPRTINAALIALKRCWNWAIDTESFGLVKNPFLQFLALVGNRSQAVLDRLLCDYLRRGTFDRLLERLPMSADRTQVDCGELLERIGVEPLRWIGRVEDHPFDLAAKINSESLGRAQLLDELLREVPHPLRVAINGFGPVRA